MAELKEARVPDIGDFDAVPVIELLVSVGDTVKQDQGLVTLESDKATMEVPAPFDGVVREVRVKVATSGVNRAPVKSLSSSTLRTGSSRMSWCSKRIASTHSSGRMPVKSERRMRCCPDWIHRLRSMA